MANICPISTVLQNRSIGHKTFDIHVRCAIESQRLHHRLVVTSVQVDSLLVTRKMLIPMPAWNAERVALFPCEDLVVDDGMAFSSIDMVDVG